LALSLFFIPDKASQSSILGALPDKQSILQKIKTKKIIIVGGSNVSFGMDSKKLEEQFKESVVNMGIHAGLGLEFIINDIKPYIKKGDQIILIPEYEHFYTDDFYGEMELVSMVFDIEPNSKQLLNQKQWLHLLKYMPTYSAKKIKNYIPSLLNNKTQIVDIYHRNSFNAYGDAYIHWGLPNQTYSSAPINSGNEQINSDIIPFLKDFKLYVQQQGATLYLFPPVIEQTSFDHQKLIITKIAEELKNNDIAFVSEPKNYCYDNTLFFNSYYHLNKLGVDKRTQQVIHDLNRLKSE
jgi:hypothetical protein